MREKSAFRGFRDPERLSALRNIHLLVLVWTLCVFASRYSLVCKLILTCVRIPSRVILTDILTMGQVSLQVLPFRFVSKIPPMLHTHLHLISILLRRTNGRSLGSCKQSNAFFFQTSASTGQKSTLSMLSSLCHKLYVLCFQSSLSHSYPHISFCPNCHSDQLSVSFLNFAGATP